MDRRALALITSISLVSLLLLLGWNDLATPIPFLLLLPGMIPAMFMPDAHFDPEGGRGSPLPGPFATVVLLATNVLVYYFIVYAIRRLIEGKTPPADPDTIEPTSQKPHPD